MFHFAAFLDEAERKYLFECDSEVQCGEWMDAIIKARYDQMFSIFGADTDAFVK